jgi:hypothetical protein
MPTSTNIGSHWTSLSDDLQRWTKEQKSPEPNDHNQPGRLKQTIPATKRKKYIIRRMRKNI